MDVLEAIEKRRSIGSVSMEPVAREDIQKILEAGNKAPNHYKIRPWRFTVIQGSALEDFAKAHVDSFLLKFPEATAEQQEIERKKGLRAPLVISVTSKLPDAEKYVDLENISATAAACQNMLLASTGLGYASFWRTTMYVKDAFLRRYLGVGDHEHLIAVLFIGKAIPSEVEPVERPNVEDRVNWY